MFRKAFLGVLLLIACYGLVKAYPLLQGPHIQLSTPIPDKDGLTRISGTAVHTETLAMNGGTLLIDNEGRFQTDLMLPRGGAILTLTATDRFGRSRTLQQTVVTP